MASRQLLWALFFGLVVHSYAEIKIRGPSVSQSQSSDSRSQPLQTVLSRQSDSDHSVAPGMEASLSAYGLNYAKEVVVHEILDEMTPMAISDISVSASSYYFGSVQVELTEILLSNLTMLNAEIALDENVITVFAQEVEANMTLKWHYSYAGLVGDRGVAAVEVHRMQVGISFNLTASHGALKMAVKERGVVIEGLDIKLSGGMGSWVYNWLINTFSSRLKAAAESAIDNGMITASKKLDDYLQSLPRRVPVDSIAAIDATILSDPEVRTDSLSFKPRCEFVSVEAPLTSGLKPPKLPNQLKCDGTQKMVTIALTDMVARSAALVYYKAGKLQYVVDQLPASVPVKLNTNSWRFILPQLYKSYPNQDMLLSLAVAAPPQIYFSPEGVGTEVEAEMVILVLNPETREATGVACLSMGLVMGGQAGVMQNNLTGLFWLDDLTVGLKWSEIGLFPVSILQTVMKTTVKNIVIPVLNRRLENGFPIPVIPGVILTDAAITYEEQYLLICTDVEYIGGIFNNSGLEYFSSFPT